MRRSTAFSLMAVVFGLLGNSSAHADTIQRGPVQRVAQAGAWRAIGYQPRFRMTPTTPSMQ